jgi:hypothetical protein
MGLLRVRFSGAVAAILGIWKAGIAFESAPAGLGTVMRWQRGKPKRSLPPLLWGDAPVGVADRSRPRLVRKQSERK